MKIGITYRLFLGMLAATATVIFCMWLIMQWSINSGFLRYINTQEQQRLESLARELELAYADHGNWQFLRDNPAIWIQILIRTLPPGASDAEQIERLERRLSRPSEQNEREDAARVSWLFERRILVLDADRRPIVSPRGESAEPAVSALHFQGTIIGYLGLVPRPITYDAHQLQFVQQQKLTLTLIATMALLVSAIVALPLARRLVRPIKTLATATQRLSAGAYQTRVPVLASHELAQLARDFNSLAQTLEKNEQSRRQWVADISHELRTPLAVLRGEIEALQDGIRPTTPEALKSLHAETLHLGHLVEDLYQLSLSDLGPLHYHKQPVDVAETLGETIIMYHTRYQFKDITLTTEIPRQAINIIADRARLHQLFSNLLENSLRYTDPGGTVEIGVEQHKNSIEIHLRDSGPGVPTAELDRIFDRLYRLEGSRRRSSGGAGLGLAICRNIVEAHNGRIAAHPSPLGGLWIMIELPITEGSS